MTNPIAELIAERGWIVADGATGTNPVSAWPENRLSAGAMVG